jgi:O-succinylhomoserine sulfhydrylase
MGESALTIGRTLEAWAGEGRGIARVLHPFLPSHPQHDLALRQMDGGGGTVVTFDVDGGKDAAFALLDALQLIDISNNLGDAKSLSTHPATTTHRRLTPEARAAVGITGGTLRVSVGLEDVRDLVADLDQALAVAERSHGC